MTLVEVCELPALQTITHLPRQLVEAFFPDVQCSRIPGLSLKLVREKRTRNSRQSLWVVLMGDEPMGVLLLHGPWESRGLWLPLSEMHTRRIAIQFLLHLPLSYTFSGPATICNWVEITKLLDPAAWEEPRANS